MTLAIAEINRQMDLIYASTGTMGYAVLLKDDLQSGLSFTVNTSTDVLTASSTIQFITSSRVRLNSSGTLPAVTGSSLNNTTDYYVYKVSSTTFKLCRSLADSISGSNFIDFVDSGSGTLTVSEQTLYVEDPITVLINKEMSHPDYARQVLSSVGSASNGNKFITWVQYCNSANPIFTFRHVLFLLGGSASSTIGDTGGYKNHLFTYASANSINPGGSGTISPKLSLTNP